MVDKVGGISLDTSVYNKPKIIITDKSGAVMHTITPRPEKAWEAYMELLRNFEKEKDEAKTVSR